MNKFQFIAAVFFLFLSSVSVSNLFAQQKDTIAQVPVSHADSVMLRIDKPKTLPDSSSKSKDPTKAQADSLTQTTTTPKTHADSVAMFFNPPVDSSGFTAKDSNGKRIKEWSHPKKALVWALVLPGAGQVYNKKYWKLPILYARVGAVAYFWITNQRGYAEFRDAYKTNHDELEKNPNYDVYVTDLKYGSSYAYTSIDQLATERNTYRRFRDMSIAAGIALYAISILDAYVDAHLSTFDLNDDISMTVNPLFYNYNNVTFAPGLSLSLNFKNNRIANTKLIRRDF